MARTTPYNSGYTIAACVDAEGTVGERVDVWVEYNIEETDFVNKRVRMLVYFYAACKTGEITGASYVGGLNSTFSVNNTAGAKVSGGTYDFRNDSVVNFCGSWSGYISFTDYGTKDVPVSGEFTTKSTTVSGGSITATIPVSCVLEYTVSFDANGGSPTPESITVPAGESMELPMVSRNEYEFVGWAESATAATGLIGTYTPTKTLTLYAIWSQGGYVYFNNNGTPIKCEVYYNNNGIAVRCDIYYNNNGTPIKM